MGVIMKKILLLLLFFSVGLLAQSNLTKMLDKKLMRGSAVGLNGTDKQMSKSSPSKLDLNGTELLNNGGFETYTGTQDDNLTASYTGWVDVNGSNSVLATASANTNYGGTNALQLTGTNTGWVRQTVQVTASSKYVLTFWVTGDGTNAGRYKIYDLSNSADIKSITSTNNTTADYSLIRYVFTTPVNCTQIRVELIAPPAGGAYARFDQVSFRAISDMLINVWVNRFNKMGVEREYILAKHTGDYSREWNLRFLGTGEGADADTGKVRFGVGYTGQSTGFDGVQSTTRLTQDRWYLISVYLQCRGADDSIVRLYIDGILESSDTTISIPTYFSNAPFVVGSVLSSSYLHYFLGQIGEVQIVRFTDISQSNVSATTLAQAYRLGIPKTWTGGSPEVVAHYKFRGSSDAQMLQDYSGNGNNLTGSNVTTADQTKGSYPTR